MVATKELGFMTNLRLLVVSFNSIELAINELRGRFKKKKREKVWSFAKPGGGLVKVAGK